MKIFTIFTASALLGAFAHAAPPSALDTRQFLVSVTFSGADKGTQFSQTFPADNSVVKITNPLSVSHISFAGDAICNFGGIDGSSVTLAFQLVREADVSPPQAQVFGTCLSVHS